MKKIFLTIISILCFCPLVVNAAGSITVSKSSINMNVGGSTTFVIRANNAAGRVDILTSNPTVASISSSSAWLDNNSTTITVKAGAEGSATITVAVKDASTYDEEVLSNTYTISVNVKTPPPPEPVKSSNTKLSNISIEGYQLQTTDNTNYYLVVDNSVDSVNVVASVEDSKSTIVGTGNHTINYGNNKIELVVTAESGAKKTYVINVSKKKDKYYLQDLNTALNLENDVNIILKDGDLITVDNLNQIKNSSKVVTFTKYDGDNKKYSIVLDGKSIKETSDISSIININTDNKSYKDMFDFNEGIYFKLDSNNLLPSNSKIRYYLGDKYDENSKFQVYYYDRNDDYTILVGDNISYKDGYVEFIADRGNDYFVKTRTNIKNDGIIDDEDSGKKIDDPEDKKDKLNIFMIVSIIEFVLLIILFLVLILRKKKKKSEVIAPQVNNQEKNLMN